MRVAGTGRYYDILGSFFRKSTALVMLSLVQEVNGYDYREDEDKGYQSEEDGDKASGPVLCIGSWGGDAEGIYESSSDRT